MKDKLIIILLTIVLGGCDKLGFGEKSPKHDVAVFGNFLKDGENNNYYLIQCSKVSGGIFSEIFTEEDTISIGGQKYSNVIFARIEAENLKKDFNYINYAFQNEIRIWALGKFERKQIPGEESREFLVLENVIGIQ